MSRARTVWKWAAGTLAVLLVVAGAGVGALRLWLEHSTTLAPDLVARVEARTGLDFQFERLDARLGLYGPELVFLDAKLTVPGQREPVVTARAGRVGFDAWRALRTGRATAGRLALDGARLYALVTDEGVQLRGLPDLADDRDRWPLDRLPVGRYRLSDATLTVEDLRTRRARLVLERVDLALERDPERLVVEGAARLPPELGARLALNLRLRGDLADPARLDWEGEASVRDAVLAGWSAFAPQWPWLPEAGRGDLRLRADGAGLGRMAGRLDFELADVGAPAYGASAGARYRRLAGELRVGREVRAERTRWTLEGRDLALDPGRDAWRDGEFAAALDVAPAPDGGARVTGWEARTPGVRLDAVAPLAAFLPAGAARDALAALAPRGALTLVDLRATRGARPAEWRFDGGLRFTSFGVGAWRAVPGVRGVDGELTARGDEVRVAVRSRGFGLDLPRYLAAPVGARELGLTLDAYWRPDGWRFATDDLRVVAPDGQGGGRARLFLPVDGSGPRLVLDLGIRDLDARGVSKYLPLRRFGSVVVDWLEGAFLAGRVPEARLEYAGEMRRFPFRAGGGLFRVAARFEGLRVHYQGRWRDAEDLAGRIVFENAGFAATLTDGRLAGLSVVEGTVAMPDFRDAELAIRGRVRGDVRDALAYLQSAPVGPRLGSFFMDVRGRGPFESTLALDFPLRRFAERNVVVETRLAGAIARVPPLSEEIRGLTGTFVLRNRDVEVPGPGVTGSLYGGPVRLRARTIVAPRGQRVLTVEADGRLLGARLQPQLGITTGTWLDGSADWRLQARWPRIEWRPNPEPLPADAPAGAQPRPREVEARWLPAQVRIDSTLAGLALRFPAPLAKAADQPRATRVEFVADLGLGAGATPVPAALRDRGGARDVLVQRPVGPRTAEPREPDAPREASVYGRVQLGDDSAVLEWRPAPRWSLTRATARLGGGTPALGEGRGLRIEGRTPQFDLSAWLRVRVATAGETSEAASRGPFLRGGRVAVERFSIFGYAFPEVTLALEQGERAWRARVDGPASRGTITVPWELPGTAPVVLDMDRLVLASRTPEVRAPGELEAAPVRPTEFPALQVQVRSLDVQTRRFGSLEASVARVPEGLRLERATLQGTSFTARAEGEWVLAPGAAGSETRLRGEVESTDARETLTAWGFAPSLTGAAGRASGQLGWSGGPEGDVFARLRGTVRLSVQDGQLLNVQPGAGRVLGLMSVAALPRRLTLDFSDLTDEGFAYDSITGDFEFRDGSAYTSNLVLKSPAAEIGIVGRTGLVARDYDQTAVVTGDVGGPLAAAGALAGGPVVGAAVLLFSQVFKGPLAGIARGYYRISGSWDKPKVERIGANEARGGAVGAAAPAPSAPPALADDAR